jgi:hypothetical protein
MDVILNHRLLQLEGADGGSSTAPVHDPDVVLMAAAYDVEDLLDNTDYKYRTIILFLPGAGIFYCAHEKRCVIYGGALIQVDTSWFLLRKDVNAPPTGRQFAFGCDCYVTRFALESTGGLPSSHHVSAGVQ